MSMEMWRGWLEVWSHTWSFWILFLFFFPPPFFFIFHFAEYDPVPGFSWTNWWQSQRLHDQEECMTRVSDWVCAVFLHGIPAILMFLLWSQTAGPQLSKKNELMSTACPLFPKHKINPRVNIRNTGIDAWGLCSMGSTLCWQSLAPSTALCSSYANSWGARLRRHEASVSYLHLKTA